MSLDMKDIADIILYFSAGAKGIVLKAFTFVIVTLLSGAIAGTILGVLNLAMVEPYIDRAISIETENAVKEGDVIDPVELQNYRLWQKGGEIAGWNCIGDVIGGIVWDSIFV